MQTSKINRCGKDCADCTHRDECSGCGDVCYTVGCDINDCAEKRGHARCATCEDRTFCPTLRSAGLMFTHRAERVARDAELKVRRTEKAAALLKYFRPLFTLQIVSIIVGFISSMFLNDSVTEAVPTLKYVKAMISFVIGIVYVLILFGLSKVDGDYRKPALLMLISHVLTLVATPLGSLVGLLLTLPAAVLACYAMYLEYTVHSSVTSDYDVDISERWRFIRNLNVGCYAAMSLSIVFLPLLALLGALVVLAASIALVVAEVMMLVCLYRTIDALKFNLQQ